MALNVRQSDTRGCVMTTAIGRIVAEVLAEHSQIKARGLGDGVIYAHLCPCGATWEDQGEWREHVAHVIEERLGVVERVEWGTDCSAHGIANLHYHEGIARTDVAAGCPMPDGADATMRLLSRTITECEHLTDWQEVS